MREINWPGPLCSLPLDQGSRSPLGWCAVLEGLRPTRLKPSHFGLKQAHTHTEKAVKIAR